MRSPVRVILFSEVNSKLGSPFLALLSGHPLIDLAALVTSPPGKDCSYFRDDAEQVDIEAQARSLGVRVLRPTSVNAPEVVKELRELLPDYFVVGNFQQILKPDLLAVPRVTAVNFHPSLLPKYAGLAPFYWMVRNGEVHGGVTAIQMAAGVDTGPIIMQHEMPLTGDETGLGLRTAQERANTLMLLELIPQLVHGSFTVTEQNLAARSYYGRPKGADYLLDFSQEAAIIRRHVRAGYRKPGAHALCPDGSRLVILTVAPTDGVVGPLGRPGTVRVTDTGVFVAARDEWLRVVTVEEEGVEVPVEATRAGLTDGVCFAIPEPSLV